MNIIIGLLVIGALIAVLSITLGLFAYSLVKLDEAITNYIRHKHN